MAPRGTHDAWVHMSHAQKIRYDRANLLGLNTSIEILSRRLDLLEHAPYRPIYRTGEAVALNKRPSIATGPRKVSTFAVSMLGAIGTFTGRLIPIFSGLNPAWVGVGTLFVAGAAIYGAYRFVRSIFGF